MVETSCAKCQQVLTSKFMKCSVCSACLHYSCCPAQQSSYNGMSAEVKSKWKCNNCKERRNSSYHIVVSDSDKQARPRSEGEMVDGEDDVFQINKGPNHHTPHLGIQHQHQQQEKELNENVKLMMQNMAMMTAQLTAISVQINNQQETLATINNNVCNLSSQVIELQQQNHDKEKRIGSLEVKISKLEQKALEKNIEINNINNTDVCATDVVEKLATKLSVDIAETDVDNAYRTKSNKIVVELSSLRKKREIMKKIERHRVESSGINTESDSGKHKYIYVNDQLTAQRRRLLWLAKKRAKDAGWKFVWVHNGDIFAKKNESANIITINTECDLDQIC